MDEIDDLAFSFDTFEADFLGAFPADIKPVIHKNTCGWIRNTGKQNKKGEHWVAVHKVDKNYVFFFFFLIVLVKLRIFTEGCCDMIKIINSYWKERNLFNCQSLLLCGAWCLYYLFLECQGRNIKLPKRNQFLMVNNLFLQENMSKI